MACGSKREESTRWGMYHPIPPIIMSYSLYGLASMEVGLVKHTLGTGKLRASTPRSQKVCCHGCQEQINDDGYLIAVATKGGEWRQLWACHNSSQGSITAVAKNGYFSMLTS